MNSVSDRPVVIVRRSRGERRVTYALKVLALISLVAVMLSAVLAFIGRIPSVAVIVIGAVFFTYVIYPLVRRLNARLPLIWSIVVVYAGIIAIVAFGAAVVVPALADDTQSLVKSMPEIVHRAQTFFSDPHNPIVAHLPGPLRTYLAGVPPQLAHVAETYAGDAAARVFGLLLSVVGVLATVVVIPVISVYLMIEAPDLIRALLRVLPVNAQPKAASVLSELDKVFGGFIRGQLTVGATIGACITIALLILHVKYAVLIGVTAGLFDIIPYVGAVVGFVPSVTLAFLNDGWQHALVVALVFVAIFQAEGHFIAPKIVSDSVGLSPLMVIVAILIGGELLGIAGMFLAVPIAAALRVIALQALPGARTQTPPVLEKKGEVATEGPLSPPPPRPPAARKKAPTARAEERSS
ncbi:MAG: AI-2E family transporter [Candidatus Eremiobacteraeota bacterium]|nr:AI-2E family transporter [Candidatus Eremiobacteraeota bacterium]